MLHSPVTHHYSQPLTGAEIAWLLDELQAIYEMEYQERGANDNGRKMCESVLAKLTAVAREIIKAETGA